MTAISLSCRVCATEHPLEAIGTCRTCFGPLDPVYDWDLLRATVTRERLASGPPSLWRYADLLPVEAPEEPLLAPGLTPLVPAPRLAEEIGVGELWLKLDTANPTHSFKDRVVAVAARKAQELGLTTLSCALRAATATTRSLKECVGFAVSSFSHSSRTPTASASLGAGTRGVKPGASRGSSGAETGRSSA